MDDYRRKQFPKTIAHNKKIKKSIHTLVASIVGTTQNINDNTRGKDITQNAQDALFEMLSKHRNKDRLDKEKKLKTQQQRDNGKTQQQEIVDEYTCKLYTCKK
ncbi:MAG: hypothetical protein ACTSUE_04045, partial [Promethearchaeota archaeon]